MQGSALAICRYRRPQIQSAFCAIGEIEMLKTVKIVIKAENDAFADSPDQEIARILFNLASSFKMGGLADEIALRDFNGNKCGSATIEESE
jgi:hypothetical protein